MSDHEEALIIGLSTVWSEAKHQLCQEHFISGLSEPVHKADQQLQESLQTQLRGLPKPPKMRGEQKDEPGMREVGQSQSSQIEAQEQPGPTPSAQSDWSKKTKFN